MRSKLSLTELTDRIQEVRRHLDPIRAEIGELPEDQRRDVAAAVLLALQEPGGSL
jgi:hypothetical protein